MVDPLAPLLADGVIDEVVARLKSGKEADLWLVRHGAEIVAAKVYRSRSVRSFRNDAAYKEGRRVRNTRTQRAMDRGSRFGQAAAEEAWKTKEADALHTLHAAGVRVPRPVMFYEGVLLMEVIVDAAGHPAPRLVDAQVAREHAAALYADLRGQMVRMLGCDLVHGDLSPYNVLLGRDGPVVIDFPQVVGAAHNSQAEAFFQRDLQNLRRFLAARDPALDAAAGDGREIWRAYVRRELTPDFVPTGRAEPPRRDHGRRAPPPGEPHARGAPGGPPHGRGTPGGAPHGRGAPGEPPHGRGAPGGAPHARGAPGGAPHPGGAPGGAPHARGAQHGERQRAGDPRDDRRGRDPRRGALARPPAPEVIRLSRPPLGPAGPPPASAHGGRPAPRDPSHPSHSPAHPGPHASAPAQGAPGAPPARRRRRGRRRRPS